MSINNKDEANVQLYIILVTRLLGNVENPLNKAKHTSLIYVLYETMPRRTWLTRLRYAAIDI